MLGVDQAIADMPGGFSAAARRALLTLPNGLLLYPLICYEAIFPDEVTGDIARADVILNVTNDAWFGNTPGPYQHFQQARVRAVEEGRPLIRDANNGISAFVDAKGRIVTGLDFDVKGVIQSTVGGKLNVKLDDAARSLYFWLIMAVLAVVALGARIGFSSRRD